MSADDSQSVRTQFILDPEYTHIGATLVISSHPHPVREAFGQYREELDRNPLNYLMDNEMKLQKKIREKAAAYLSMDDPAHITLTDSTTVGLGTIYTGLNIMKDRELLLTEHKYSPISSPQKEPRTAPAAKCEKSRSTRIWPV